MLIKRLFDSDTSSIDQLSQKNLSEIVKEHIEKVAQKRDQLKISYRETVSGKSNSQKKRLPRKLKWRDVSKELTAFKCRRNADENPFYFLNSIRDETFEIEDQLMADYCLDALCHDYTSTHVVNFILLSERLENPNEYTRVETQIHKNLKKLVKTNELKSLLHRRRRFEFQTSSITKGNMILHIKYHLFKELKKNDDLNEYLPMMSRLRYTCAQRRVDARHRIEPAFLAENKKFLKSIKKLDLTLKEPKREAQSEQQDSRVVIANSLDRSRDLADFDANYLEFLIQLQHRDITPEDYDFLTRLDERVKKKTLNDEKLSKLKTETFESHENDECCGICLDSYQIGCLVRCLPCGHRFHAECIDNWLKNQSVNCPLDNLPIDGSSPTVRPSSVLNHQQHISTINNGFILESSARYLTDSTYSMNAENDDTIDFSDEDFDFLIFDDENQQSRENSNVDNEVKELFNTMLDQICHIQALDEEVESVLNSILNKLV